MDPDPAPPSAAPHHRCARYATAGAESPRTPLPTTSLPRSVAALALERSEGVMAPIALARIASALLAFVAFVVGFSRDASADRRVKVPVRRPRR